jgi:cytochrome c6
VKQTTGLRRVNWIYFSVVLMIAGFSNLALAQSGSGADTFKSKCVLCHGADGTGNTPLGKQLQAANLRSKDVQKKTNAELHTIIHDGKTNMPPFGDQLSDEQINQVIRYVRSLAKSSAK